MHIQSGRIADFYNSHVANKSYTAAMQTVFVSALAFMLCFASPSMAQEGVPVPTLDKLSGQAIPDTVPVQYYPESAPGAAGSSYPFDIFYELVGKNL